MNTGRFYNKVAEAIMGSQAKFEMEKIREAEQQEAKDPQKGNSSHFGEETEGQ